MEKKLDKTLFSNKIGPFDVIKPLERRMPGIVMFAFLKFR